MDVGRLIVDGKFLDATFSKEYIRDNLPTIKNVITQNLPQVVSIEHIRGELRRKNLEDVRQERERKISTEKQKKFDTIKQKLEHNSINNLKVTEEFQWSDMVFSAKKVAYRDIILESKNSRAWYSTYASIKQDNDFNTITNNFITSLISRVQNHGGNDDESFSFTYGSEKAGNKRTLELHKKESGKARKYYINNVRINLSELKEVITNSLCFTNEGDFNHFLKSISKLSLEMHRVIGEGLVYKESISDTGVPLKTKLVVVREERKNYLEYLDATTKAPTKLMFQNLRKFINRSHIRWDNLSADGLVYLLRDNLIHTVDGYDDKENVSRAIIAYGQTLLEEENKKAKEEMETEMKKMSITTVTATIDKAEQTVYIVKGESGRQYAVSQTGVCYEYPNMRYICIADTQTMGQWDKIVSRFYALKNDSVMATKISTLRVNI